MKYSAIQIFYFIAFSYLITPSFAQTVFSEKVLDYKKAMLPYDVAYTIGLPEKEFVMLQESKKNTMKLGRYDQYFFEKWEKEIVFDKNESAPQIFIHGDSLIAYSFSPRSTKQQLRLTFRYFDLKSGEEQAATKYVLAIAADDKLETRLTFSEDHTKFVIFNYKIKKEGVEMMEFQVFALGSETALYTYQLASEKLVDPMEYKVHLSNQADLFAVAVDVVNFKSLAYYWGAKNTEITTIENTFFFERPAQHIQAIDIVQQGASSYFVTLAASIEDELIGFNVTGINVVLKNVMFTYNQNLKKEDIEAVYNDFELTSQKQKKKLLAIPDILENFRLVQSFENEEKDVILAFEELEVPVGYHQKSNGQSMPWKFKSKNEKYFYGGDILLFSFSQSGDLKWEKVIQKSQYSQGNSLGLSYIPHMENNQLSFLVSEISKGGNFYIFNINTVDGSIGNKVNLLPDLKAEFVKKYSCWLNGNAVVICGISPVNASKRTLMLVEF